MSVVIDQIDVRDVRALEFEDEPPIAGNRNRPLSFSLALHRVKSKTRVVQIARTARGVERGEQNPQPSGMPCIDPPRISRAEKSLQALVPYSRDHPLSVTYRLSHFQPCSTDPATVSGASLRGPRSDLPGAGCSRQPRRSGSPQFSGSRAWRATRLAIRSAQEPGLNRPISARARFCRNAAEI
jgi:hypothetical protein